jgi:hypothetical protein
MDAKFRSETPNEAKHLKIEAWMEDDIKIGLKWIELEAVDWINFGRNRDELRALVVSVMNIRVP